MVLPQVSIFIVWIFGASSVFHKKAGVYEILPSGQVDPNLGAKSEEIPPEETVNNLRLASFDDVEGSRHFHSSKVKVNKSTSADVDDEITVPANDQLSNDMKKRKLVPSDKYLWPDAIIVYKFNETSRQFQHENSQRLVRQAMMMWEESTCVRFALFEERSRHGVNHGDFLDIGTGVGCASVVGYAETGPQVVYLSETNCMRVGIVAHELGHSMGLFHEQSRQDRVGVIRLVSNNIQTNHQMNFARKYSRLVAPYDLGSIMHYGPEYFSKVSGKDTIITTDPRLRFLMGQRIKPSYYDFMTINKAYKCNVTCTMDVVCLNDGYQDGSCSCRCPDGLTGPTCEAVSTPHCGKIMELTDVSTTIVITSPNYPDSYNRERCVWLILAPTGRKVRLVVKSYDIARDTFSHTCYHWLEIRYNLIGQDGPSYCGSSDTPRSFTSAKNSILVSFDATNRSAEVSRGFKMTASLIPVGVCDSAKMPCKNGATCNLVKGQAHCTCLPGFIGKQCQHIVGEVGCTFDAGHICFLIQASDDQFQWTPEKGGTPSKNTGPAQDVGGSGYYIFTEASRPRAPGQIARLYIRNIKGGIWCLTFQYHMYGLHMGTLVIYILSTSGIESTNRVSESGNHNNTWMLLAVNLKSVHEFHLIIEGVRGRGWSSDMALDNLSLKPSICQRANASLIISHTPDHHVFLCDFTEDFCGMLQDTKDDFNWLRHSGNTPSQMTGPEFGYGQSGYYIYIEASFPRVNDFDCPTHYHCQRVGHVARISTPVFDYTKSQACVSFAAHSFGSGLGKLTASVHYIGGTSHVVWGGDGAVNDYYEWLYVTLTIPAHKSFKVVFEAVRGTNYQGDYALDNVGVQAGECGANATGHLPSVCDFESGTCPWESVSVFGRKSEWTRQLYTTVNGSTNLIRASLGPEGESGLNLVSPVFIFIGRYCFQFDYSNEGEVLNPFSVYIRGVDESEIDELWSSDVTTEWDSVAVAFTAVGKFQVSRFT